MKTRTNKLIIALITVALVGIMAAAIAVGTYAIWKEQAETSQKLEIEIDDYNPSEQYIVFSGLTSSGAFSNSDATTVAYAAVGYTGLVAEVKIPATHNGKPVTQILVDPDVNVDAFCKNPIITKLTIPSSVVKIGVGACSQMEELVSVHIDSGDSAITICDMAFAGCVKLRDFDTTRTIIGDEYSYLVGTPNMG